MSVFSGKVIVVTGASDGIGAELARQLAAPGVSLALAARGLERLEKVAADCAACGAQVLAVRTDVAVESDCRNLIERTVAHFGAIDILVNNAGVSGHAYFEEVTDFAWYEQMMQVNLFGAVWCTRHALAHLKARRGLIVAISSLAGKTGVPGRTAYCASKFALSGFFEALRIELRDAGVDVTIIYPAVVATQIRHRGYGPDGRPAGTSGLIEESAMPVKDCARQIVSAMTARRRELVMTALAKIGLWMKLIAPRWVDQIARAKVKHTR